jgi:DNA-binding GntR family transcriptional regulator/DNA-binding LacI/PurR family transcriptional regulator
MTKSSDSLSTLRAKARACEWIRNKLAEGAWHKGESLPNLDELSAQAGVSRGSMWSAMKEIAAEGLITTQKGSRAIVGQSKPANTSEHAAWKAIAASIAKSVHNGILAPGAELPPLSKLHYQYPSCYRTLRKSLESLVTQKVLVKSGCRYLVPRSHSHPAIKEIAVFWEPFRVDTERTRRFLPQLEEQAHKLGIRIKRNDIYSQQPLDSIAVNHLIQRRSVAGILIDVWNDQSSESWRNMFTSLMDAAFKAGKRIALIDENSDVILPEPYRSSQHIRIFAPMGTQAGTEVGNHVLTQGHRKAAFITCSPKASWSQDRYRGVSQAFSSAGLRTGALSLRATMQIPVLWQFVCAAGKLGREDIEIILDWLIPRQEMEGFLLQVKKVKGILSAIRISPEETTEIQQELSAILLLFKTKANRWIANRMRDRMFDLINMRLVNYFLRPVFEGLLDSPDITAWVADSDLVARSALRYLQQEKIPENRHPAIVSFDNSAEASFKEVSSYEFDIPGLLHQALSFTMSRPGTGTLPRVNEHQGILYVRKSSEKKYPDK